MPRSNIINLACGDIAPADMTLKLTCSAEELSESQLAAFEKAETEYNDIKSKLRDFVSSTSTETVYLGEIISAYQKAGNVDNDIIDDISKPVITVRRDYRSLQAAEEKNIKMQRARISARRLENAKNIQVIDDDDDDEIDPRSPKSKKFLKLEDEYMPPSKRIASKKSTFVQIKEIPKKVVSKKVIISSDKIAFNKPNESAAIGGLCIGEKKKEIVDLTKEESDKNKLAADTREISFNKLQGKTFPSLVAIARPMLKGKEINSNDRSELDSKVKSVLMHNAATFTEWLIQKGLVRSEQYCQLHPKTALKLGVYSDYAKFQYSGGYVWISECCTSRFVSVFNGSIFEGATQPPTVILKLIYHWSCQTNVQNVVQWVKVDNTYVKAMYTWFRAICTMALHNHLPIFGGANSRVEIGVISLGTTSQGGQQKQVKVEVIGILDTKLKLIRLRAIEPITDGDKNYKKRFAKIFEPLATNKWVHPESIILTDLTIDKGTLIAMGYKNIIQTPGPDGKNQNATIMEYLRTVVPRMFQNTLSLLSRPIIQQFLDELVWREWYGVSPGKAFENLVQHIAEQSLVNAEPLVVRLNKVSANPFKNWSVQIPKQTLKQIAKNSTASPGSNTNNYSVLKKQSTTSSKHVPPTVQIPTTTESRLRTTRNKRKELSPTPSPPPLKKVNKTLPAEKQKVGRSSSTELSKTPTIKIESYYYGLFETGTENDSAMAVAFEANCPECDIIKHSNNDLMDHIKAHVNPENQTDTSVQCRYCLTNVVNHKLLDEHLSTKHPNKSKSNKLYCLICSLEFATTQLLRNHMHSFHRNAELPFKCGCCDHLSSSQRTTIDHFYGDHTTSGSVQCPFCLRIFVCVANKQQIVANIIDYMDHLRAHMSEKKNFECTYCSLSFIDIGALKAHLQYDHDTQKYYIHRELRELCAEMIEIPGPKYKKSLKKEYFNQQMPLNDLTLYIDNGLICIECGEDFQEANHFCALSLCPKCSYRTACSRSILQHIENHSNESKIQNHSILDNEMYCICGFSSTDGDTLAKHLIKCGRKSAYLSQEVAESNKNKINSFEEDDEDSVPDIPVDQQKQLLSKSIDDGSLNENSIETKNDRKNATDDFNTQLSLDDLAPSSVAPPPVQTELDRTPQLSDEYQSLATPRVSTYTNDYDMNNQN